MSRGAAEPLGDPPDHGLLPSLRQVAPGVRVRQVTRWRTCSTVVVSGDRCLVVDPALTPADLAALGAELVGRGLTVVAGFSTHPHWDHLLWSDALGDVPRWATARGAAEAHRRSADLVAEMRAEAPGHDEALLGAVAPLPDGARGAVELPWEGTRAVVLPYPAHCPGSAALVLPDAGVLVAGDMLSDVEVPLLDREAEDPVRDHRTSLTLLEEAAARWSVRVLVPGHGSVTDAAGLARRVQADRAYLDALAAGEPVDDPRLTDPEQAVQHAVQVGSLSGG